MKSCYLTSICVTILSTVILVGCSGNSETAQVSVPQSKNVSTSGDQVADDATKKSSDSIPDSFPSYIYVADGWSSTDFKKSGGKDNLILQYPEGGNEDLVKNYLDGMSQKGWAQETSSELPIGTITNFSKDSRKCTISISPPKDKTITVAIIY